MGDGKDSARARRKGSERMGESEKEMLDILLGDSLEVLECQELTGQALHSASVHAFNSTVDKIAERFPSTKSDDVEFVSAKVPFAKLIPILSGLIIPSPDENPEDFWLFSLHNTNDPKSDLPTEVARFPSSIVPLPSSL